MKTASEIPVGFGFVGIVDSADWYVKDKRHFEGELVKLVAIVPGPTGESTEQLIMNLFAGLRWEHGEQLGSNDSMWVAGVRPKRSKYVRIFDWATRCSLCAAEKISVELVSPNSKLATA